MGLDTCKEGMKLRDASGFTAFGTRAGPSLRPRQGGSHWLEDY